MIALTLRRWPVLLVALLVVVVGLQAVPYGRAHTNPPVTAEPSWDSPGTRALAQRACFDCHSNETEWPAYASLAPISWVIQHDVDEGRAKLNFSEWQRPYEEADEAAESLLDGEMPLAMYRVMHAHARLTPLERQLLADGLERTLRRTERRR